VWRDEQRRREAIYLVVAALIIIGALGGLMVAQRDSNPHADDFVGNSIAG
jgi:hypothetical protein